MKIEGSVWRKQGRKRHVEYHEEAWTLDQYLVATQARDNEHGEEAAYFDMLRAEL